VNSGAYQNLGKYVLNLPDALASHGFGSAPHRQTSRSAKPESVRLSFEESFAKPRSLRTFRISSSGKSFHTKPNDFQSELALTALAWNREQF